MHLIDTHTHLFAQQFDEDRSEVIHRALVKGVKQMLLPNIDCSSIQPMLNLCAEFPNNCFPMIGLHPCDIKKNYLEELEQSNQKLVNEKIQDDNLKNIQGMTIQMLALLAKENILTLNDFAELATFELIDKEEGIFKSLDVEEELANKMIMEARRNWFE